MSTFAAVQAGVYNWCIQRSDGYYLQRNGSGATCWSITNTTIYFLQQKAQQVAWAINNRWVDAPPIYWTYASELVGTDYCPYAGSAYSPNRFLVTRDSDGVTMWQYGYGSTYGCTAITFNSTRIVDVLWALVHPEAAGV